MKIYLDDDKYYRYPPDESWVRAYSYQEAVEIVEAAEADGIEITEMSLDHDLAYEHYIQDNSFKEETGYTFIQWLRDNDKWPTEAIHIHTANPIGAQNMINVILYDNSPYNRREGRSFYV